VNDWERSAKATDSTITYGAVAVAVNVLWPMRRY
jgi:hypothetical protein